MSLRTVDQAFNEAARHYDDWVRRAIPGYEAIFSTAIEVIPFEHDAPIEVLDLGAGTGLFSQWVVRSYPKASFVLYDLAEDMLQVARQRFSQLPNRCELVRGDLCDLSAVGRFDLVISSLAIHHLAHDSKQQLFRKVFEALRPRGAFVNVDQVKGEAPVFDELNWNTWLAKVRQAGAEEERIQESIRRRKQFDRDATLPDQLRWLREAGFEVECVFKNYFVAVFLALKGSSDEPGGSARLGQRK